VWLGVGLALCRRAPARRLQANHYHLDRLARQLTTDDQGRPEWSVAAVLIAGLRVVGFTLRPLPNWGIEITPVLDAGHPLVLALAQVRGEAWLRLVLGLPTPEVAAATPAQAETEEDPAAEAPAADAAPLADALKGHRVEGVPSRIVENYAVPAALLAVAQGHGEGEAVGLLERLLAGRAFAGRVQADDQALVRALLGSLVSLGVDYETRTVAQILTDQNTYEVGRRALEKVGLVRVEETPGRGPRPTKLADCPYLFIGVEEAQRHLLKGTPFANGDIKEILLRLEHRGKKAQWVQRKLNGVNVWGCAVPVEAIAPTGVQEGAIVPLEGEPGEGGQRLLWPLQAV
jgi:hypothetical protein